MVNLGMKKETKLAKELKLTPKMRNFCHEYLLDFNTTQAAIRAGYSKKSAYAVGNETMKNPRVARYINELRRESAEKLNITKERILKEYARLAFSDVRKAYGEDGNLLPIHELDEDTAAVVAGVESDEIFDLDPVTNKKVFIGNTKKLKLWNKADGLAGLTKMLGFNAPEKFEGTITGAVVKIGGLKLDNE